MSKLKIDFGDERNIETPLYQRKSISMLLGAGFSAPMGYPVGNGLNEELLNFDDNLVDFAPSGELAISTDGQKPQFQLYGIRNYHQKRFEFCQRLIHEYYVAHDNMFDYELFYDFITSRDEAMQERYQNCV
jgi:hypothetical protein